MEDRMDSRMTPAFSEAEYARRLGELRARMQGAGLDGLLVVVPENVNYLTGYESIGYSNFSLLVVRRDREPLLFIREMERTVAETTTALADFETFGDTEDPIERAVDLLRKQGALDGRLGVELGESFVSPAAMDRLRRLLGPVADGTGLVEQGRRLKSAEEIAWIRRACRVTEAGMGAALGVIRPGATENAVAAAAYAAMMAAGSDFFAGDPIVTSGWRSGVAHLTFGNRRLEPGDTILLELGGCRRRYFGPLMRGAAIAPVRDEARRMADTILEALAAAIAAIRPGATSGEVDAACRGPIERAGYEPNFRKRTGYSVGVGYAPNWGEGHIVSLRRDDPTPLEPGMVFHMPPALRVPREYGLGFSETVLVTATGVEVLTDFPRRLHVAGEGA
jgi:Xaa-Pro dipeptidase